MTLRTPEVRVPRHTPEPRSLWHDRGFALLEALVAAWMVAIGLMGLAALQLTGPKHQDSAEKRAQASLLADDMIERMRMNRVAEQAGRYDTGLAAGSRDCGPATCSATPIERSDLCQWKQQLRCLLPGGDGAIRPVEEIALS